MRAFTAGELDGLQNTQEGAMMDKCIILEHATGVVDGYGNPTETWIPQAAETICGYNGTAHKKVWDGTQVAITDATLRLPIGTSLTHLDQIQITERLGTALATPPMYSILGEPRQGASGLLVYLRSVS
jgi:hypothetical protein